MHLNPQIHRLYYSSWNGKCGNPPTLNTPPLGNEGVCKICSTWPLEGGILTAVPKIREILVIREGAERCNVVLQCGAFSWQRQHANTVWAKWLQKRCYSLPPASDFKRWLVAAQLLSEKERVEIQDDTAQVLLTYLVLWPFFIFPISEPELELF